MNEHLCKEEWLELVMESLAPGPGYGFPDRETVKTALRKFNVRELAALENTLNVLARAIAEGS